ncbi:MAG: SDR family NAD(P)-dependent oxidoreductase [Chitinophagaceae bacterium]|nr:SDR family NAD(P)-dependent oxidoreductase [Chitinophagaceae bacterium]MCA6468063.1 SDR family NAD(P)-dependent oxidoreductase [Chitinophagaceae bacterium]MCA6470583.1 SDR family NAD(P)-dependent oxidoreductase [Chitinophagaceae bacterium]MCA6478346.1 SDR family NAD(P)-dependent oxidoreductase [Chitinophagaceae bacterium]MCA6479502.1 SDR family NAD(P)-dependent oxidoreductase [Chitinophagaceae bacterium]
MSLFNLTGKTAVVTGSDKGIGKAMAVALAEAGANVIGTSRSGDSGAVQQAVEQTGRSYQHYNVDFSDRDQIYAFTRQLFNDVPRIDVLVNNAGTILRKPATEHPDEYWDQVIQINLTAQFILGRELGKHMIAHGSGKIIFICSLLSFQGGITVTGYTASKSGLAGLVRAFSNEWAAKGIGVNGIAPGYIATDNTSALREDPERNTSILQRIPAARWGTPEDLKGPVQFLAGKGSDYVNGTILFVDGGWMSR